MNTVKASQLILTLTFTNISRGILSMIVISAKGTGGMRIPILFRQKCIALLTFCFSADARGGRSCVVVYLQLVTDTSN